MTNFVELGKKIYDLNNPREAHRCLVFLARCCLHPQRMSRLEEFFDGSETLRKIAEVYPYVFEQATRAFFYHKSTFDEREKIVRENMEFFARNFDADFLCRLYSKERFELWRMELDSPLDELRLTFCSEAGQRKEGFQALVLRIAGGIPIYGINFWIARDDLLHFGDGAENALWIGALQGANIDGAKDVIKQITKKCHAYRTKNLILYAVRAFARALGLKKIYAVTNDGYYANNHIRRDRKLKTSFGDFWAECGGVPTSDKRFFALPTVEERKTFEEIPAHKRAAYRRRFALLDEIDAAVEKNISALKLPGSEQPESLQ